MPHCIYLSSTPLHSTPLDIHLVFLLQCVGHPVRSGDPTTCRVDVWTAAEAVLPSLLLEPFAVRIYWLVQIKLQPKVNYGHSLRGGISLTVIAHGIPLPCASFLLLLRWFMLQSSVKEQCSRVKGKDAPLFFFCKDGTTFGSETLWTTCHRLQEMQGLLQGRASLWCKQECVFSYKQ